MSSKKLESLLPFLLVLVGFGLLLPAIYGVIAPYRDSGDLIAASFSLGIAHPPGYSLYTLLTKTGMNLFPLGNPAYRANFLSLLWTCASLGILFKALGRFVGPWPAILSLAVWFLSHSAVQLSNVSEMYSLNAFLASAVLWTVFSALKQKRMKTKQKQD